MVKLIWIGISVINSCIQLILASSKDTKNAMEGRGKDCDTEIIPQGFESKLPVTFSIDVSG